MSFKTSQPFLKLDLFNHNCIQCMQSEIVIGSLVQSFSNFFVLRPRSEKNISTRPHYGYFQNAFLIWRVSCFPQTKFHYKLVVFFIVITACKSISQKCVIMFSFSFSFIIFFCVLSMLPHESKPNH